MNASKGKLLHIYISEADKYKGKPLYEWIVQKAKEEGLAGATVLRGMEGFGAHRHMHTSKVLRLAQALPIVIEIVDGEEAVNAFLKLLDGVLESGYCVVVDAVFHSYGSKEK